MLTGIVGLRHFNDVPLPAVLLFKPALDPLAMIFERMTKFPGGLEYVKKLEAGQIPHLPIPVDATHYSPDPGNFILTPAHVNDVDALRLLTDTASQNRFQSQFQNHELPELILMTAEEDDMCPAEKIGIFSGLARHASLKGCEVVLLNGKRADDHSDDLKQSIIEWAQRHPIPIQP